MNNRHLLVTRREAIAETRLLSCDEMAECDAATAAAGLFTGLQLMAHAGAAVIDVILSTFPGVSRVQILCGPGNNCGDGYVAATGLQARGVCVQIAALGKPRPGTDAQRARADWDGPVMDLSDASFDKQTLVIDALFGAGFRGELPPEAQSALRRAAMAGAPILAIDLPSGINGDTGLFDTTADCRATVTFFRKKPAHCLFPAREKCGAMTLVDIGVKAAPTLTYNAALHENGPLLWGNVLPQGRSDQHKYSRGHVAVFSGPRHATGAARLCAMAAQRTGAGAVTLLGTPDALDIHAHHVTSIMLKPYDDGEAVNALAALKNPRSAVLGPGFSHLKVARSIANELLTSPAFALDTLVLDADAITAFADAPHALFQAARNASKRQLILTPHDGEFGRLFSDISTDKTTGKVQKTRVAARLANAVVVYKGPDTVIAAPDGRAVINTNATPALATAGSGDVLAGIIAALTAGKMSAFEAACAGVWIHAEAAQYAGPYCIAEHIISSLPASMAAIGLKQESSRNALVTQLP